MDFDSPLVIQYHKYTCPTCRPCRHLLSLILPLVECVHCPSPGPPRLSSYKWTHTHRPAVLPSPAGQWWVASFELKGQREGERERGRLRENARSVCTLGALSVSEEGDYRAAEAAAQAAILCSARCALAPGRGSPLALLHTLDSRTPTLGRARTRSWIRRRRPHGVGTTPSESRAVSNKSPARTQLLSLSLSLSPCRPAYTPLQSPFRIVSQR